MQLVLLAGPALDDYLVICWQLRLPLGLSFTMHNGLWLSIFFPRRQWTAYATLVVSKRVYVQQLSPPQHTPPKPPNPLLSLDPCIPFCM
jgi:hypothetical protein